MKSISACEVFSKFPDLRKQLCARELWNDGYFVRSVRDEVTADIIRKYIDYYSLFSTQKICAFGIMMNEKLGHRELNAFAFGFGTKI